MRYALKTWLLFALVLTGSYANAIESVQAYPEMALNLGNKVQYLIDPAGNQTLTDTLNERDSAWTLNESETPNFGYTNHRFWFRVRLLNTTSAPLDTLLTVEYPLLDHLEFYQLENGKLVRHFVTGDIYPFKQRPTSHRDFLFPLTLSENKPVDMYIRMSTQGSAQLPIKLYDTETFLTLDRDEQFIKALYYGMMLVMLVYNLFLYLSIREQPYIYYVSLIFSLLVLMAGSHGFLYQYIYPESPALHKMSMLLAVPSIMLFACLFASYFLRLPVIAPQLNRGLNFFSILFLMCVIGAFILPYGISTRISVFLAIPGAALIMFSGPYAWRLGQTSARYFTIAWVFLLSGILVGAASKFGFLPRNFFTETAINWGSALEAILLSFALADRFNRERNARFTAQRERLLEAEQRKEAEHKLYHQATHQSVDDMPNMVILQQVIHAMLHSEHSARSSFTIAFIHLNRFHEINKTLGHANADLILSLFSQRLKELKIDEEKSIVLENTENDKHFFCHIEGLIYAHILKTGDTEAAMEDMDALRQSLAEPIEFNGMQIDLGLVIGLASYPIHGPDMATLIRHTRVATDVAAKSSRHIGMYSSHFNPYSARRLTLMGELRKAILDNSLELYFQPIINCQTQRVTGAEALLRWNHPELGFVPPDEFVRLAEKTGIIRSLTQWVLNNALAEQKKWPSESGELQVSINISAINLQEKDFIDNVKKLLNSNRISPQNLVLEVTETAVMSNPDTALESLKALAAHEIKIAIDDFGTGHSSLSYIRKLPVYEVKIDRSFVIAMDQDQDDALITRTTINLSHDLGYKVVAEGVENEATLSKLKEMGSDFSQGFHIAKPMTKDQFLVWLQNHELNTKTAATSTYDAVEKASDVNKNAARQEKS